MSTWHFAGIPAKLEANDGTVVGGLLEKVEFTQEHYAGMPVGPLTAVATLRAARGETPFGTAQAKVAEPRSVALDAETIKHLTALHAHGVTHLRQVKAMMKSPIFAPGATLMAEELGPALVWLASILRKEGL
jgi:hypothetical protein